MRRTSLAVAMLTMSGLYLLLERAAPAQPAGGAANNHALAIGVVKISPVFHDMQETKNAQADFRAQNDRLAEQQRQREAQIQALIKHRDDDIKPGTVQWQTETSAIDQKTAELDVWARVQKTQLEREFKQNMKLLYDHIAKATAEVAEQEHLDLVIADQSPDFGPSLDSVTAQRLSDVLSNRAVLYANKKADITDAVLTRINADYANANRAAGPDHH